MKLMNTLLPKISPSDAEKYVCGFFRAMDCVELFHEPKQLKDLCCPDCQKQELRSVVLDPKHKERKYKKVALCVAKDCPSRKGIKSKTESFSPNWEALNIPPRKLENSLDNYQGYETRVKQCRDFLTNKYWCLTLWGAGGTGKTHLAIGILKEFYKKYRGAQFFTITNLLQELREAQVQNESEYGRLGRFSEYPALVIDDLGATRGSDWQIEKTWELIDMRCSKNKKTIITTNLNFSDLKAIYGIRLLRRISECAGEIEFKPKKIETMSA